MLSDELDDCEKQCVHGTMTHRVSNCPSCQGIVKELNDAIDLYNDKGNPYVLADIHKLLLQLDECERHCHALQSTLTHRVSSCPSCQGIVRQLNAAIDAYNTRHGVDDLNRVNNLAQQLAECEKNCHALRSGFSHRVTSCPACQGLAQLLNYAIDVYNAQPDLGRLRRVQELLQQLEECERNCDSHATGLDPLVPLIGGVLGGGLLDSLGHRRRFDRIPDPKD